MASLTLERREERLRVTAVVVPVFGRERLLTCSHSQVRSCHLTYTTKYRTVEQHKCQGRSHKAGKDSVSK